MTQVPNVPAPNVQQSSAPQPTQQLDAPAQAFGASVGGQVANDFGEAEGKVSANLAEYANTVQTITNKSNADQGTQGYTDFADQRVAQFKEQNPGLAAQQNLPALLDELNAKRAEFRQGMSPLAAAMYDQESRRIQSYATSSASQYSVTATHKYNLDTADGTIKMNQKLMSTHPTDLDALATDYQQIAQAVRAKALLNGTPDNLAVWEIANAVSEGARQAISGISNSNPMAAADLKKVYEQHGFLTPTDSDYLDKVLKAPLTAQIGAHIADAGMDAVVAAHPTVNGVPVGNVPQGSWDKGVGTIAANPAAELQKFAGVPVTVTSAGRTPEHNAAAGGSPTSEHLSNSAWDFVPKSGDLATVAQTTAANLHAAGIPFDQVEIAGDHIHVGFGPKNRNEIIAQGTGGAVNPVNAIEAKLPALLDNARAQANTYATKYNLDPAEVEQSVVQKTVANYDKYKLAYSQQNTADQAGILSAIEKGGANGEPIGSKDELFKQPGMAEAYARLTPTQQHSLDANMNSNANQMTGPREEAHGIVRAMADIPTQQQSFLQQDFTDTTKWDLTRSDQLWALNKQAELRGAKAKTANEESTIQSILKSPQFSTTMSGADIKSGDPEYLKIAGSVQGELESWSANPANQGKKPSPADINAMAQKIFTNYAAPVKTGWFGMKSQAQPSYTEVPDADRQYILGEQTRRFPGVALNEQDIARIYHLGARAPHAAH